MIKFWIKSAAVAATVVGAMPVCGTAADELPHEKRIAFMMMIDGLCPGNAALAEAARAGFKEMQDFLEAGQEDTLMILLPTIHEMRARTLNTPDPDGFCKGVKAAFGP